MAMDIDMSTGLGEKVEIFCTIAYADPNTVR